jgi:hypothetical protein
MTAEGLSRAEFAWLELLLVLGVATSLLQLFTSLRTCLLWAIVFRNSPPTHCFIANGAVGVRRRFLVAQVLDQQANE